MLHHKIAPAPIRFALTSVVWGEKYTDLFLNFLLPNYLSGGNLPLAAAHYTIASEIYTTPQDAARIARHPHYKKLREQIDGALFPLITEELLRSKNKWGAKGYCQSLAIKKAIANGSVVLLFNPDSLIGDGGIARCCALIEQGKRAVVIGELARVEIESILPELQARYHPTSQSLRFSNRELVDLGIRHLHRISKTLFWRRDPFTFWPSIVYWNAGDKSLAAKFFHLHPLAIDLRGVRKKIPETLMPDDGGLIEFLGIKREEIHTVTDSEELVCIELSSKEMAIGSTLPCPSSKKQVALVSFARKYALASHIDNFLRFTLRFQGTQNIDWKPVKAQIETDLEPLRHKLLAIAAYNAVKHGSLHFLRSIARLLGARYIKRKLQHFRIYRS